MYADYEYYKDVFLGGKEAQISASDLNIMKIRQKIRLICIHMTD